MVTLLGSHDAVTSLVDYYGFRDKGDKTVDALESDVGGRIRTRVRALDERKVIPYVQRHEFEGLLFSDVGAFGNQSDFPATCVEALQVVRDQFTTPEDVNDGSETAPSKRIRHVIPRYNKVVHGPALAAAIGLADIRAACPRFDDWIARLESLGTE